MSQNEKRFMTIVKENIHITEGNHYEVPLLFKNDDSYLLNNVNMVQKRLQHPKKQFPADPRYLDGYTQFMEDIIEVACA